MTQPLCRPASPGAIDFETFAGRIDAAIHASSARHEAMLQLLAQALALSMPTDARPKLVSIQDAAKLGVTAETIRRWGKQKRLEMTRIGPRVWRVTPASIDRMPTDPRYQIRSAVTPHTPHRSPHKPA